MPRGDVATSGETPRREQRRPWLEETCGLSPARELVGLSRLVSRPTANASLLTASDFRQCAAESMPARAQAPGRSKTGRRAVGTSTSAKGHGLRCAAMRLELMPARGASPGQLPQPLYKLFLRVTDRQNGRSGPGAGPRNRTAGGRFPSLGQRTLATRESATRKPSRQPKIYFSPASNNLPIPTPAQSLYRPYPTNGQLAPKSR